MNRLAISSAVLGATVLLATWITLGKALILIAGYDDAFLELGGEPVPMWPARIRLIAAIELVFAGVMGGLALVGLTGRQLALPLIPYFVLAFTLAEFSELISYLIEVGTHPFPTAMLAKVVVWIGWFAMNVALFRKRST